MSASEAGRGAETSGPGEVTGPGGVKRQGGEVILRSRGQIVKGGFLIALGLAPLIFIAAGVAMPFSAPVAFFLAAGITGAAWSFFFLPELRYNAEGLSIINPLRTIRLPWGAELASPPAFISQPMLRVANTGMRRRFRRAERSQPGAASSPRVTQPQPATLIFPYLPGVAPLPGG